MLAIETMSPATPGWSRPPPLALLSRLFSLIYGVSQIGLGVPLRQTGRPVMEKHAA
jgi:hypothetical protein